MKGKGGNDLKNIQVNFISMHPTLQITSFENILGKKCGDKLQYFQIMCKPSVVKKHVSRMRDEMQKKAEQMISMYVSSYLVYKVSLCDNPAQYQA